MSKNVHMGTVWWVDCNYSLSKLFKRLLLHSPNRTLAALTMVCLLCTPLMDRANRTEPRSS